MFISLIVVWLSFMPKGKVDCGSIRPHPSSFYMDVTESDPGGFLRGVKVPDQGCDKIVFFQTVDRHQVGTL